jgi:hypothetical protein
MVRSVKRASGGERSSLVFAFGSSARRAFPVEVA